MIRRGLWWRGALWLALLGPLFFVIYTPINQYTATRGDVGQWVWAWEQHIPFWPWTIVPYWSENLLYGLSLFVCTQKREQTVHALRLLAASLLAAAGFLLWPLRYTFERAATDGLFGALFTQLKAFDLPYNQAPSLHIILAWLLWLRYQAHVPKPSVWRYVVHAWALLIALSVLTTWQHHFIDVLWGAVAGVAISYALPIGRRWQWQAMTDPKAVTLRRRYGASALAVGILAYASTWTPAWPLTVLLVWIALDLALLALAYWRLGRSIYQKDAHGQV
ncbi:MAG: phosphatase PAP2 family protein, partial [Neisseriaceae bacterium]|nr:phosphatase PAP2 family protein [Neisseriaceae bacterium]